MKPDVKCPQCEREWTADSEQAISVELFGNCITCRFVENEHPANQDELAQVTREFQKRLQAAGWRLMKDAPRDGTLVTLLISATNSPPVFNLLADELTAATVGFNNLENTGIDKWEFAGWSWEHDCFEDGHGVPIGWRRFNGDRYGARPERTKLLTVVDVLQAAERFFEGEYWQIEGANNLTITPAGDRETVDDRPEIAPFDHVFIDQGGGGETGDDFHGRVYWPIGGGSYLVTSY